MSPPAHHWDPGLVLAHDRYLRALARSLIADAQVADDLAQQTWLQAIEHRPAGSSFHAWLRTTLTRLAVTWRRRDTRRAARERAVARQEGVPSHEELSEREAVRRALVDAVLCLPEPYRSTVALRYFEGLPPRAIAKRMHAPVETVRTRLKTALARLRATLDRSHGDRRAWCVALAPLGAAGHAPGVSVSHIGVLSMTTKTKVFAAASSCAALLLLGWWGSRSSPSPAEGFRQPAAAALDRGDSTAVAARDLVASDALTATSVADAGSLVVHLRWHDGTPAESVGVRVQAASDSFGYAEREARSDTRGDARFVDLSSGPHDVFVDRLATRAKAMVSAGQEVELTVVVHTPNAPPYARARRVEGSVVTPDGAPLAGAAILLSSTQQPRPLVATHSGVDGTFSLRDVDPTFVIEARAPGFAPSPRCCALIHLMVLENPQPVVPVRLVLGAVAGRVRGRVFAPRGPGVARAIVQIGRDLGGRVAEDVRLADGTLAASPTPVRVRTDADGGFATDGIAAGDHDVVVRAPGFGAWTGRVAVVAGAESALRIDLAPGVTVRGRAADANGTALSGVRVGVGERGLLASTHAVAHADGSYELRDLAPGEIAVLARYATRQTQTTLFGGGGETLSWDPILARGLDLAGRVLDERGEPVDALVHARGASATYLEARAATDRRTGEFVIVDWQDVPTEISVIARGTGHLPCARVALRRLDQRIEITVRAADMPSAFLTGTLLDPNGRPAMGATIHPSNDQHPQVSNRGAGPTVPGVRDGAFEVGPLPPGTWHLEVRSDRHAWLHMAVVDLLPGETRRLGTLQLRQPAILQATAKRADGSPPAADATWSITDEQGHDVGWLDMQDGTGHHEKLATGTYFVQARCEGVADSLHRVSLVSGERTQLEVTQVAANPIAIEFVSPSDDLSVGVRVSVHDASGAVVVRRTFWRHVPGVPFQGSVSLLAGTYRLEARTVSAVAGCELRIDATLAQPLRVELR